MKRTPIISLKVPKTGCEDCSFQSRSTQYLPPFQCLPTSSHTRTHTQKQHTCTHAWDTDCQTGCATGDFKGTPPGAGPSRRSYHHPRPRASAFPFRPRRSPHHSFIYPILSEREREPCPGLASPASPVKVSPHQDPASGGPAADRNLQGLAYGAPDQATCGMSLIRDSRYRRNSINPSALSVRPPPLDANIERWGNVSIPTSPTARVGTRLRLIVGRLVFIIAL